MREANQAGALQPTVLASYEVDLEPVLDGREPAALAEWDATPETPAAPDWRVRMRSGEAPTRRLARRLIEAGVAGLLVPGHARGAEGASTSWRGAGGRSAPRGSRSSTTRGGCVEGPSARSRVGPAVAPHRLSRTPRTYVANWLVTIPARSMVIHHFDIRQMRPGTRASAGDIETRSPASCLSGHRPDRV